MVSFKSKAPPPPPPQSRFLEGSMNDRVSAVPPADFLGPDAPMAAVANMDPDDYERQFALDWKPPDLQLEGGGDAAGPGPYSNSNQQPRSSFVSIRSSITGGGGNGGGVGGGASSSLTRIGTGASSSIWSKAPKQHGSSSTMSSAAAGTGTGSVGGGSGGAGGVSGGGGFLSRVGGRFGLTRSKSSFDVVGVDEEDGNGNSGGSGGGVLGNFIPPVFKHKRSESVNSGAAAFFKRESAAKAGGGAPPPPPPGPFSTTPTTAPSSGPVLPGFDPTRRPTRDEITANYQSLLASGFFGTHAIQSTRFSAPGQRAQQQQQQAGGPDLSSFAQRKAEEEEEEDEQTWDQDHPPSPERQPPPPPPNRLAPPPPPPPQSMAMDTDSSSSSTTPEAIPVSPTILFHPTRSQQRPLSECMPPPPARPSTKTTKPNKPNHKANLSFSAVPYSSTRPGIEPAIVDRPYRPPPVSLARFSLDSSGRQSFDFQQQQQPQRGIKRPFTAASNGSQASFATAHSMSSEGLGPGPRGSGEHQYQHYHHRNSGQYGNAFMAGIAEEDKPESGARKLVKKLRKSASRISIDLGKSMGSSRQSSISRAMPPPIFDVDDNSHHNHHYSGGGGDDDEMMGMGDDTHEHNNNNNNTTTNTINTTTTTTPSARTSMSSTVRRSFSWKFGKLGPGGSSSNKDDPTESQRGGGGGGFHNLMNDTTTTTHAPGFVLNNKDMNRTTFAPHAPHTLQPQHHQHQQPATTAAPTNHLANFSFLTGSSGGGGDGDDNDDTTTQQQQESHLKKRERELRGRRLRKHGSRSPLKQSPAIMADLPTAAARPTIPPPPRSSSPIKDGMVTTTTPMDCQHQSPTIPSSPNRIRKPNHNNRSRSRSRSNVIRVLHHSSSSRPSGTVSQQGDTEGGMPATITTSNTQSFFSSSSHHNHHQNSSSFSSSSHNNNNNMMEGVEFSFHFPGRMRPTSSTSSSATGGPLAVVPDANRGLGIGMSAAAPGGEGGGGFSSSPMMMMKGTATTPHHYSVWGGAGGGEEDKEDMIY